MLNVNHEKVESFFDCIDQSAITIYENAKKSYLEGLLYTLEFIAMGEANEPTFEESLLEKLNEITRQIYQDSFNKEEIRKAVQLALLKAFKSSDIHMSHMTPDSIGMLFAYFADLFFKKKATLLDTTVGTGNLLYTILNNSRVPFNKVFAVDESSEYIQFAYKIANLLEYEIDFFNQDNLTPLLVPPVDLVVSDFPNAFHENGSYLPFLMVKEGFSYGKEGSYFIYLIPNDFFNQEGNQEIKEIIFHESYIYAIIQLPNQIFTGPNNQKSILILRKKGENILPCKEILMLSFPNFTEAQQVSIAIDKINQWFKTINKK